MSTSTDTIEQLATQEYKYGFVTDRGGHVPPGAERGRRPGHLAEEGRARVAARVAPQGATAHWLTMTEPTWPNVHYPPIDYQAISYYSAPKPKKTARTASTRSIRSCARPSRSSASRSTSRSCSPASRSTRCSTASRSPPPSRRSSASSASSSARSPRRCASTPSWCASTSARSCRTPTTSSRRSTRRSSRDGSLRLRARRACAARWSCRPTSASTPQDTGQFERTLIVADEGAYVSYLEGCTAPMRDENQLHAAVVELVALDDAHDQVLDRAELVPRRQGRQGRHLQLRHQARQVRGRDSKISWTQVETGSAITWKYPSCILQGDDSVGEFYSVALTNNHQQADTGTKMIHIGKNTRAPSSRRASRAGHGQNTYRGLVKIAEGRRRARATTRSATRC